MLLRKPPLPVVEASFDIDEVAYALWLTPEETERAFRDPRLTGWLAEIWGTRLFGYKKHAHGSFAGSDGQILLGPVGQYRISVKTFLRSLKFQQSKFVGSGRSCSQDDLIHSLETVEVVIAVDLRAFPKVSFYPIDSKLLLKLVRDGGLTASGMTARSFDNWVAETFEVERRPLRAPWEILEP